MKQLVFIYLLVMALARESNAQTFSYDFTSGYDSWSGDFADYPVTDSVFYELAFTRTTLPAPLNTAKYALKITGNNHSDDLFLFIKRKVTGLLPNTTYTIKIEVAFASIAPTNAVGVGGAPGEGVIMKAGATLIEPVKQVDAGYYRMNINKANQAMPGPDMDTIGHVGVSDTTTVFTMINRSNATHLFTLTTNANGEAWICIGTDSGFEATTTLYYDKVTLTFSTNTTGIGEQEAAADLKLFPNPARELLTIIAAQRFCNNSFIVTDIRGRKVMAGKLSATTKINTAAFPAGIYLLHIAGAKDQAFKWIKQ